MSVKTLDEAISKHPFRPKGIKVGVELAKKSHEAGRLKMANALIFGAVDWGFEYLGLDEDIFA